MAENTIHVRSNFPQVAAWLEGVAPKQAEFATMVTLNRGAYEAAQAVKKEMASVFDAPTPWVMGSVRYVKATRSRLVAKVDFDQWGNKYGVSVAQVLKAEIGGGKRALKRFEVALARIGILPSGMGVVPGEAAKIDRHGNISAGQIVQILSWFQAFGQQGYSANMTDKGKARLGRGNKRTGARGFEYFVVTSGMARTWNRGNGKTGQKKMQPGIYQRIHTGFGSAIRPVMIFVRMPAYKARLDFYGVGYRTAMAYLERELPAAVAKAVQTAR